MVIIIVLFILLWIMGGIGDVITVYDCKREGDRMFDEATKNRETKWRQESQKEDFYYNPSPNGLGTPNYNFYSDGSLKQDISTGKAYSKGQYYCRNDGVTADRDIAGSNVKRPPKN